MSAVIDRLSDEMIVHTAPQGSQEWLDSRQGVITASRFKDARDKLKSGQPSGKQLAYAMDLARERAGGTVQPIFQNGAMRLGQVQEPMARAAYEEFRQAWVDESGFITTPDAQFGVSVDGLVGNDGAIEIKTMVSSATLFTAVVDADISEYRDQCVGLLWLLNRQWCDLVLWAPDLEHIGREMTVIRIERNQDEIDALAADLIAFARRVDGLYAKLMGKS
jgi:hypothetical protein